MTIDHAAGVTRERRLANLRATLARPGGPAAGPDQLPARAPFSGRRSPVLAGRLAAALGADVAEIDGGWLVRRTVAPVAMPLDRRRLADLPGHPPADAPLVCIDTETTGLATAAGTLAFLVGLARWEGDAFCQTQLLLPDHADEPALLAEMARWITPDAWLVSYNGRGFDWPLIEARYRLAGRAAPAHAGHLDLLPFVRRVFRHRMEDARLRTVEGELLGVSRIGDVEGWEIPAHLPRRPARRPGRRPGRGRHPQREGRAQPRAAARPRRAGLRGPGGTPHRATRRPRGPRPRLRAGEAPRGRPGLPRRRPRRRHRRSATRSGAPRSGPRSRGNASRRSARPGGRRRSGRRSAGGRRARAGAASSRTAAAGRSGPDPARRAGTAARRGTPAAAGPTSASPPIAPGCSGGSGGGPTRPRPGRPPRPRAAASGSSPGSRSRSCASTGSRIRRAPSRRPGRPGDSWNGCARWAARTRGSRRTSCAAARG